MAEKNVKYLHMSKKSSTFAADFAPMSEQNHYIVDLKRLSLGVHTFDYQLDKEFFASVEKTEILGGEVACKAVLNLREEGYELSLSVRGTVFVVCDRCLDPMPLEVDACDELMNDDAVMPLDDALDLSWLAYETVSINIPVVHSHQPGECNAQMDLLLHDHLCDEPEPEDKV